MTTRLGLGIAGLVLVAALGGCGQDEASVTDAGSGTGSGTDSGAGGAAATTPAQSPSTGTTQLLITMDDGTGATTRWTLTCNPPGGDLKDPAQACETLAGDASELLAPIQKGLVCTEIYGGPQTATVTGTYAGAQVKSRYSRANGCEISRWDALTHLLPKVGTGPM